MNNEPILITGVGKRLGFHLASALLDRDIPVIGSYRSERDSLIELTDKGATLYPCDFYIQDDIDHLVKQVRGSNPSLRAIIHNASDWLPDNADFPAHIIMQRMIAVHVDAPYQINLALSDLLMASQHTFADIIHVGDYVSSLGSKKHIAYAASKAAQDNLTLSFATKLAPKVKVNSIAPALMLFNDDDGDEYKQKTLKKSLLEKEGGAEEFIQAVHYLLDSQYITGRVIPLDGGRHLK